MEKRIIELEIRSAFQEQKIEALNEAVFSQLKDLEKLAGRVAALERRLTAATSTTEEVGPADEKPPHY